MPKLMKMALIIGLPLALGGAYGLAKLQVIPTQKMGQRNPGLARALRPLGLYHTPPARPAVAAPAAPAISPEQQALTAQREALDKERAAWESQKTAQTKAEEKAKIDAANALPDPREVARLASIYEQMPADSVVKIFAKMPDPQTIALMRRMEEKKVGEILALLAPERAAFFTQQLTHAPRADAHRFRRALTPLACAI